MQEQGWRMKKTAEIVANNIKVLRDILGLNHEQFAQRVQLPAERIKQMENAKGTLDNCIDILRIAQSCNVQYMDLFEDQNGKYEDSVANAYIGKHVMDVIEAKRYKLGYKKGELCEKVGAHSSLWSKWVSGEVNPSVLSFNNLIVVLGLHYYDFTNTIKDKAKEDVCIDEEPEPDVDVEIVTERTVPADDFETRMLKVVRLQRKIDDYLEKLDEISNAINSLRNELASMK